MATAKTVIAHFYNESYLLRWWIPHHRQVFDHGILIDYASTDDSVAIIRELAPDWEVVASPYPDFSADNCNQVVMATERRISGWKMALNITEFLFCQDLDRILAEAGETAVTSVGIQMADPPAWAWQEPDPGLPLVQQRYWGFYERQHCVSGVIARERLLHSYPDGQYQLGRHQHWVPHLSRPDLLVLWYGCSPLTERLLARRLQIQTRIPYSDRVAGLGWGHFVTREELLEGPIGYNQYLPHTRDLRATDPMFSAIYAHWYGGSALASEAAAAPH